MMFEKRILNSCLLTIILLLCGCGVFSSDTSGLEPNETLTLDDDFEMAATIGKGELISLDMREPVKSGYVIVGTSFDPEVLSLVHYLQYDDDGDRRVQYIFKAAGDGGTDVLIKMEPSGGGQIEIYKRVTVNIGDDSILW